MSEFGNFGLVLPTGSRKYRKRRSLLRALTYSWERGIPEQGRVMRTAVRGELMASTQCQTSGISVSCSQLVLRENARQATNERTYANDGTG